MAKKRKRLNLPDQWKGPRPYKGQNFKGPSDGLSTWHDLSDPNVSAPNDPQDFTTKPDGYSTNASMRWFL